ncbi:MAG: histidine kinase N-terminal 7TM domain-containing protein [Bacteroidota bacterium]
MYFPPNLYSVATAVPALVCGGLAIYAWRRRSTPAAAPLAILMAAVAWWAAVYAVELAVGNLHEQLFLTYLEFVGVVTIPAAWLIFALEWAGLGELVTRRRVWALTIMPCLTLAAVWTNPLHGLIYAHVAPRQVGALMTWTSAHGPAYWVHVVYSYILILAGIVLLVQTALYYPRQYRFQALIIVLAALFPWLSNILVTSGLTPTPEIDITPAIFTITGLALSWSVFRLGLLDVLPVARDALFEAMADGVLVVDEKGRILDLNSSARMILGLAGTGAPQARVEELLPCWQRLLEPGGDEPERTIRTELEVGSERRTYELRVSALHGRKLASRAHLLFMRDVTASARAEQALRETEVSYHNLFDTVKEAVYIQDREGRFLDTNRGAERTYGYDRSVLIGQTPAFLSAPGKNDLEAVLRLVEQAFDGVPQQFEFWGLRSSGEIFPSDVRLYSGTYLGKQVVIALAVDITERKRSEQALLEASQRFEAVIEHMPTVAIQGLDRTGKIQHWNKASEALYGISASEALGQRIQHLLLSRSDGEEFLERVRKVWAGEVETSRQEWSVRTRRGEKRTVDSAMFPVRKEGAVIEVFCMDLDITDRRRVEQAQRLAAVGQLAAGVAHEFNNLLAAMLLRAELASDLESPEARELVGVVLRSSRRGAEICSNLMAFARPQAPRQRHLLATAAVEAALRVARPQLENSQIKVRWRRQSEETWVFADRGQLEQVFLNLIINACHAMSVNEVPLARRVLTLDAWLDKSNPERPEAVISVGDGGVGIAPRLLPRIFEPFFTTREGEGEGGRGSGTGLGLSVSHGIITAHEGTCEVQSVVGLGTTFEVRLPIDEALNQSEKVAPAPAAGTVTTATGRLLLAEDETDVRAALAQGLKSAGYSVTAVGDTDAALRALREQSFDIVVSDLMMPGAGGSAVAREAMSLPTLIITGNMDETMDAHLARLGNVSILRKPFDMEELRVAVSKLASHSDM